MMLCWNILRGEARKYIAHIRGRKLSKSVPFSRKVEDEFDAYATYHKAPIPIEIYLQALLDSIEEETALPDYNEDVL